MISFRGSLTDSDRKEAARLTRRVMPAAGTFRDPLFWLGAGIVALTMLGLRSVPSGARASLWWLPFALLSFALWWRRRVRIGRPWRTAPHLSGEVAGVLDEEGLEGTLGGVESRLPWPAMTCHLQARDLVVLMVRSDPVVLTSRMFGGPEAWREAGDLIVSRVPRPKGASPVVRTVLWLGLLLLVFLLWHFAQIQKAPGREGSSSGPPSRGGGSRN